MEKDRGFRTVRGYQILNDENKLLTSSMEDYLEMIYRTCMEDGFVRTNQLADKLNVRPSSATKVIQKLNQLGLINYQRYGIIRPTEAGKSLGGFLLKRHEVIQEFLRNLGIEEALLKATELIEHDVSPDVLQIIHIFNKFIAVNPDIKGQYEAFKAKFDGKTGI